MELEATQKLGCWSREAEHLKMANALNTQAPEDAYENTSGLFVLYPWGLFPRGLILMLYPQLFKRT